VWQGVTSYKRQWETFKVQAAEAPPRSLPGLTCRPALLPESTGLGDNAVPQGAKVLCFMRSGDRVAPFESGLIVEPSGE